jgi:uncharacterized protein (TIRG00374 family)
VSGCLFLLLAVRGVQWLDVKKSLMQADWRLLFLAVVITLVNTFVKILRWNYLLLPSGTPVKWDVLSASFLTAQLINSLLPLRAGEISRVFVIGGRTQMHGFVLGSILAEKYLDTIAYGILIGTLIFLISLPDWLESTISGFIIFVFLASLLLVFVRLYRGPLMDVFGRLSRSLSDQVRSLLQKNLEQGLSAVQFFQQSKTFTGAVITTALIWITALATNQLVILALDIQVPFEATILILVAVLAGISLPALPGKIGVFEYACVLALGVFGVDRSIGLSYGILLHIIVFLPIMVLGFISIEYLQIKIPEPV